MSALLDAVKRQKWFYEFSLPDGSTTESYLDPQFRAIHATRERALRQFLAHGDRSLASALDVACHEGFFSIVLADYFNTIVGIDKNVDSLSKARQIAQLLARRPVDFRNQLLEQFDARAQFDFVLCFGLMYHVENPMQVLRNLARLTKHTLCIETQLLPFDFEGSVEDGSFLAQRPLHGLFGLCEDYAHSKEGGLTNVALVPSRRALEYGLRALGFNRLEYFKPTAVDYEQFIRGHRVVMLAER